MYIYLYDTNWFQSLLLFLTFIIWIRILTRFQLFGCTNIVYFSAILQNQRIWFRKQFQSASLKVVCTDCLCFTGEDYQLNQMCQKMQFFNFLKYGDSAMCTFICYVYSFPWLKNFKNFNVDQKMLPDRNLRIYNLWESSQKVIPTKK